ncbi:hypothetical protein [Homoserinibacter sp. GY 40078]|uniref:PH-like domain-containing protein n=1 Tax=Homoserinibacter sp. GY 40078 TaxID=2603275 RepID=UPI0011C7CBFF|nr:hypothetical protein [Homoserinibacter sp. GY 40078]TXK17546.1 hypothetical protein FVQ89_12070 [Homoserinibacter sp. GY 40078]
MADTMWPVIVVGAMVLIALGFGVAGWRNRRARQSALDVVPVPPEEIGDELARIRVLHVATTLAEQPLERVVVGGLGFRARGDVRIARGGVVLDLAGAAPAFIPTSDIRGVGLATWAIDRGVEKDGLVFIRWELGGTGVDSYLRADDPQRLLDVLSELSPAAAAAARSEAPNSDPTDPPQEGAPE